MGPVKCINMSPSGDELLFPHFPLSEIEGSTVGVREKKRLKSDRIKK